MHLRKTKLAKDLELCTICNKNDTSFFLTLGSVCSQCFVSRYGDILLEEDSVQYYGGHNAHVAGGKFRKHHEGHLYLTEKCLIFVKEDKDDASKRWEIIILLANITLDWRTEEEGRRKRIDWEGTTINNFGFGSGFLYESGHSFHLMVPYVDEHGSSQCPRFDVSDKSVIFTKWAAELYVRAVQAKMSSSAQNILGNDIPQTTSNCFNCGREFAIYEMNFCVHCLTAFCSACEKEHSHEGEGKFYAKYLGGHKMYPKPADTEVFIFSDHILVPNINLRITYFSMINIENADENKISALRVVGLGLVSLGVGAIVGALWKKRHIYTIIEYLDTSNEEQTLVFDFEGKLEEAQQIIYSKMVASHSMKQQLLETHRINEDLNSGKRSVKAFDEAVIQQHREGNSAVHKTNQTKDDPLNILKVRLARGEITKAEYEEMRKIVESQ